MCGAFLREVRRSRNMTQAELAEVARINQPNISAYENDRRAPSIDVLNRWLVACGYQLVADGGSKEVRCPLPKVGWFPDEDVPFRLPDDPPDEEPVIGRAASLEQRLRVIDEVLAIGELVP